MGLLAIFFVMFSLLSSHSLPKSAYNHVVASEGTEVTLIQGVKSEHKNLNFLELFTPGAPDPSDLVNQHGV